MVRKVTISIITQLVKRSFKAKRCKSQTSSIARGVAV